MQPRAGLAATWPGSRPATARCCRPGSSAGAGSCEPSCNSFLYALWRRGESEYEDADDPFPKGRIPFLTVHQAKGLEFPVVVLGNPRKQEQVQAVERMVRPLLDRGARRAARPHRDF